MKQVSKNETAVLDLISKIQIQLTALDRKVDSLISRSLPPAKQPIPTPKPPVNNHQRERAMHTAICADCKKECSIPFKPSGDRPVYCKDCFSRRKMISMSGMKVEERPQAPVAVVAEPPAKAKRKAAAKKPVAKKKPAPKKKR